ncbi:MAG TPA: beta-glucosidase, partial [Flavihumibacter sp.]|nr:beta-glucosidase [Flavihumibacter sp.]
MKQITTWLAAGIFFLAILAGEQATAQKKRTTGSGFSAATRPRNLSDSALLDLVQKQTFRYFWDFAHPVSGLARERSNNSFSYGDEVVTTGGTGFGVMAVIVASERKWITRDSAARFLLKMVKFLSKADSYHGVFPHWLNGATGKTIPFSRKDDGADLVETSYLFQGLLCAAQYFDADNDTETSLRNRIGLLWNEIEWNWFTRDGREVLYWHWSPNNGWAMNHPIRGYNECLITYVLAAAAG